MVVAQPIPAYNNRMAGVAQTAFQTARTALCSEDQFISTSQHSLDHLCNPLTGKRENPSTRNHVKSSFKSSVR